METPAEVYFGLYVSDRPRPEQVLRVILRRAGNVIERWEGEAGWWPHATGAELVRNPQGSFELVGYERAGALVHMAWEQVKPYLEQEVRLVEHRAVRRDTGSVGSTEPEPTEPEPTELMRTVEAVEPDVRRFLLKLLQEEPQTRGELIRRLEEQGEGGPLAQLLTELDREPLLSTEVIRVLEASLG